MVVDGLLSVIHAAVAGFDCVTIKDSFEFVVFREVLVFYGKESVCEQREVDAVCHTLLVMYIPFVDLRDAYSCTVEKQI